jgi:hypothetical protein
LDRNKTITFPKAKNEYLEEKKQAHMSSFPKHYLSQNEKKTRRGKSQISYRSAED